MWNLVLKVVKVFSWVDVLCVCRFDPCERDFFNAAAREMNFDTGLSPGFHAKWPLVRLGHWRGYAPPTNHDVRCLTQFLGYVDVGDSVR